MDDIINSETDSGELAGHVISRMDFGDIFSYAVDMLTQFYDNNPEKLVIDLADMDGQQIETL